MFVLSCRITLRCFALVLMAQNTCYAQCFLSNNLKTEIIMKFQKKKVSEQVRGILGKHLDGTETEFREATEKIVEAYKLQFQQPPVKRIGRWKCMLCGRDRFTHKSPHKCVGGYRKRKIIWQELS